MVKVSVLFLALCGLVSSASASNFQAGEQQSGQEQKDATAVIEQSPEVKPNNLKIYRIGGDVKPPQVLYAPDPAYTELTRKAKLTGMTLVSAIVGVDGSTSNVRVVRSMAEGLNKNLKPLAPELDQKAIEAVQQYRFKPATRKGQTVPVELTIMVAFRIY
jgi:TonB family protein